MAHTITILLTLFIPILILPNLIDNCFNAPKFLLLLVGVAGITVIQYKELHKLPKIVIALIIINFLSFFYTLNPYYTKIAVCLNVSCLLLFFFVSEGITQHRAKILMVVVTSSGLIVSVIAWCQFFGYYPLMAWAHKGDMIFGTIGNSNYLGAYLIFPVFAALGMVCLSKPKWKPLFTLILLIIAGAFLIAKARSSWIGLFCALPVFFYLARVDIKKIILVFLVLVLGAICLYGNSLNNVLDSTSLQYRLKGYFPPAVELIKQSPIFGNGLWSYRNQVYEAQSRINETDKEFFKGPSEFKPRRVHNEYLEVLVDGGIIAFALCFMFLYSIAGKVWIYLHKPYDRMIVATLSCAIIAILVNALMFFPFRVNDTLFMTCLFLGMLEGLCRES